MLSVTEKPIAALAWSRGMTGKETAPSDDRDQEAVARFLAGDTTAFDELYTRYADYVYNIAYGVLNNREAAEDVTQEVFVLVYRALRRFRKGSRFSTWLYRIAVNRALDEARAVRRRRWVPFSPPLDQKPAAGADPASKDDQRALSEVVSQVLSKLPEPHRRVLTLRHFADLNVEELADVLGCSVAAAKVRLHRARKKFREVYERLYPEGWDA